MTTIIILSIVALACAIAVIYPYLVYPAILSALPKRPIALGRELTTTGSQFSLLFCAYNETKSILDKIENLERLLTRYPDLEVLAFDDGSTDDTKTILKARAPFVKLFSKEGRNGKAHGMKILAGAAKGEFLIFTDANVLLDLDAIDNLLACYNSAEVGGVCGSLHYLGAEESSTSSVGGFYWKIEEQIKDLESDTGSVMGADGSIFSIRKEFYPDFPDTVLDDFTVSMEVVFKNKRLIKSSKVIAYERLVSARADEFSRKTRIAARAYHTHTMLRSKRASLSSINKFKYVSHKVLRWFGGAFLIVGATCAFAAITLASTSLGLIALTTTVLILLFGLRSSSGTISSLTEVILAMLGTLIGVVQAILGKTYSTWNPAKSR